MGIQILCGKCKSSSTLEPKKCPTCGSPKVHDRKICTECKTAYAICPTCKAPFDKTRKYRIQVALKGKRVFRVVDNLTIARELESTIKSEMLREEYDITAHKTKKVPTLNDLWAKYLPWAMENKKSWKEELWSFNRHLAPRFGNKTLDSITGFDLEKMKSELKKSISKNNRPFAPQTIKHQIVIIRRLFNLARKWGIYDGKNPVDNVQMPRVDNQITEFLRADEMERLLKVLADWPCRQAASFVLIGLFTGLRKSEIRKLRWEHLDLERTTLTIVDPKGKQTTIPINAQAAAILKEIPRISEFVFPGRDGELRKTFEDPWHRIREAAELPAKIRFHALRHNFGSWMVSSGIDLYTVSKLLNHRDLKTTQRYAHLQPGVLRQATEKAGELLIPKAKDEKLLKLRD